MSTHKNFKTIVDDHSRSTWTYLLKHKSQSLDILKIFLKFIHTHFNTTIKVIRSDNALEFDSGLCNDFFHSRGIIHQTTCVERSQQNGRVERKHRHVLAIARALRFQASLPLQYWGECVLTVTYLINRLSTPILQNRTPFEVLFQKPPSYDHLKVFGCLAFAVNPNLGTN